MPTYVQDEKLKNKNALSTGTQKIASQKVQDVNDGYNADLDTNYQAALAALNQAEASAPTYTPSYNGQLQEIYGRIIGREPFKYDVNADALYQQMKDQYIRQGKIAMMDTMGQAAAMTGGYGSSYGQSVGQQAYNSYLQELNSNLPAYYDRAYQQYAGETDAMLKQYSLTGDLADRERADFENAYNRWVNERSYAADRESAAYNRGLADWQTRYNVGQDLYARRYQEQQDAYSRQRDAMSYITSLISSTGYNPTDTDLSSAGMTRAQADALLSAYQASKSRGGGGSGNNGSSAGTGFTKADYVTAMNRAYEEGNEALAEQIKRMYMDDPYAYSGSLGSEDLRDYNYWKSIAG